MHTSFLETIVAEKKRVVAQKKALYDRIRVPLSSTTYPRYALFKKAITKPGVLSLIAEIKKASPSKGLIRADFDVRTIAQTYADAGVSAISVLAEEKYFLGSPSYVKIVSDTVGVPVLAKDFFIDEGQIYEARFNGASAILLIMAILDDATVRSFIATAHQLDLDCVVEVHSSDELARAIACGADIIGVNNRDLRSFSVDIAVAESLIPRIPHGVTRVVESGISTHADIERIKTIGADAVLIGETFMKERDIARAIKDVMYGQG